MYVYKQQKKFIIKKNYIMYQLLLNFYLKNLDKFITNNVNNMSYMFYGCKSLSSLSDISRKQIMLLT